MPLNHTDYNGKKFDKFNKSGTKAKAIVGKYKKNDKWTTQSILIPKEDIHEVSEYTRKAPVYNKKTQKVRVYLRRNPKRKKRGKK